jgi:glycosyltransferase involved in cell wall biosynthesis
VSASITLAIPFHSGVDYLMEAVASVRAQTQADWNLLVVDDGGRDQGVRERLDALGDERVRTVANETNLGMVPSWNRCLDEASTELVTLLHADDLLLPDYVERMRALLAAHPEAVAGFCEARIIGPRGEPRRSFQDGIKRVFVPRGDGDVVLAGEPGLRAVMRGNFVMCPTLCWRRGRLGARRFDPAWKQVQDLDLVARLLLDGETLVGSRRVAYAYRRHKANATALQTESFLRFDEEYALFDAIAERAEAAGWRAAARTSRRKTIVRLHLAYRAVTEALHLRLGSAGRTLRFLASGPPRA